MIMVVSFSVDTLSWCLSVQCWNFVRAARAVAFSFAPVCSLKTKIKSSEQACKWKFGCYSSHMISFATRFQNVGPVQEPCAHPCCCDQLTMPWAVWMVTFLSVSTSLRVSIV
ncbi:hypothetical protein AVEN_97408-1 [Araneus ventricosus]|uniref:Secreted protein n=1 Tax=Araneus ventricosus TaxID=182803 RepID=A0A4Y2W552_ARAVE|nr:hypothetical protein AVEN_97408-1 [Araneus ventricosus]